MGKYLCAHFAAETKLNGLTRFKRSKALSVREEYTMSKKFDTLGLKVALDSIIMEVFNSLVQPSPLFTAQMQLMEELSLKELLMPKWASVQTDWMG